MFKITKNRKLYMNYIGVFSELENKYLIIFNVLTLLSVTIYSIQWVLNIKPVERIKY